MGDSAVTVENDGERQSREPVAQGFGKVDRLVTPDERRVVQVEFLGKLDDFIRLINGDANELQPAGPELPLRSNEFGHLLTAGTAPRRPEINDEYLPPPLAQGLRGSLGIRKRECKQCCRVGRTVVPDRDA